MYSFDQNNSTPSAYEAHSDGEVSGSFLLLLTKCTVWSLQCLSLFPVQVLILLDTTPDEAMLSEGVAREVVNRIQKLRKKVKATHVLNMPQSNEISPRPYTLWVRLAWLLLAAFYTWKEVRHSSQQSDCRTLLNQWWRWLLLRHSTHQSQAIILSESIEVVACLFLLSKVPFYSTYSCI